MEKKIFAILGALLTAAILIGCGSVIATMSTESKQKDVKSVSAENKPSSVEEKKETSANGEASSPTRENSSTENKTQKISNSIVSACEKDAADRFEEWFLTCYSNSYGDLAVYSKPSNTRTQTTENTVSVAFEMEPGIASPYAPTFSVTASYTVENGTVSLFSFDVR